MVLELEREAIKPSLQWERSATVMFAIGGILGTALPLLFAPHLSREAKLMSLLFGSVSAASLTYSLAVRQRSEAISSSLDAAERAHLKQILAAEVALESSWAKIDAQRQLAAKISRLPASEQPRWIAQYKLQGIIPAPPSPKPDRVEPIGVPPMAVAPIAQSDVDAVVNPSVASILQDLAAQYPGYVRLDAVWVDELCEQSADRDMSKRRNHHFYLGGETQSGKSTLCGVLIRKIAAFSEGSPIVVGNDPKDGATRWLCKFSKKFDGFDQIPQWIQFALALIDRRKNEVKQVGGTYSGVSEMFFIQDELDSSYGGGKGLPGIVDKKTAENLQALCNFVIKFTAGLRCHGFFLGQNPLSGATGFSRPEYKNVCFITLGQVSSYVLDNPKDFLNVRKDILEMFRSVCEMLDSEGVRYALVVPTRGKPFVALIPQFDVEGMQVKDFPQTPESPIEPCDDPIEVLAIWFVSARVEPSDLELIKKWQDLTGLELNSEGLENVRKYLKERRNGVNN